MTFAVSIGCRAEADDDVAAVRAKLRESSADIFIGRVWLHAREDAHRDIRRRELFGATTGKSAGHHRRIGHEQARAARRAARLRASCWLAPPAMRIVEGTLNCAFIRKVGG